MDVVPSELAEVISETPAMWPNCRSSGVATEDAMICALAPGSDAPTEMVGKSTWGRGETGNTVNAIAPAMAIAIVNKVVATGRRIKRPDGFMPAPGVVPAHRPILRRCVYQRANANGNGKISRRDYRRKCKSLAWCKGPRLGLAAIRPPSQFPEDVEFQSQYRGRALAAGRQAKLPSSSS